MIFQKNSISISQLISIRACCSVCPPPPGVGVHCRRCYCLFKFTQEPLKEPQGPLVRLPTLKTSKSLKIHDWRPALRRPSTEQRAAAAGFAGGIHDCVILWKVNLAPVRGAWGDIVEHGLLCDGLVIERLPDACRAVPSGVDMLLLEHVVRVTCPASTPRSSEGRRDGSHY